MIERAIRLAVRRPLLVAVGFAALGALGWQAWRVRTLDALPDIARPQVIVTVDWPGRAPEDVEDQVTYPLASALAGVRGIEEVRARSSLGAAQLFCVLEERVRLLPRGDIDAFYRARTRVLEKLAVVAETLPEEARVELGPDATALGQVFAYTLEGPLDLGSLRAIQDTVVAPELAAVPGVAEVASVGGFVREYRVEHDPLALRDRGASAVDVLRALRRVGGDRGARTIERAGAELVVRGLGAIRDVRALEDEPIGFVTRAGFRPLGGGAQVAATGGAAAAGQSPDSGEVAVAVRLGDVARVEVAPAFRRGALVDARGETVGGIVAMRYGENPLDVVARLREVVCRLDDPAAGVLSQGVRLRPIYDRAHLVEETAATLSRALESELWVTLLVVLAFLGHVTSALVVALGVPMAVLLVFLAMRALGIDSNATSLAGIAIAIGTMVDTGVVLTESIDRRLAERREGERAREAIEAAALEVGPAIVLALATTIVSFLPILFLAGEEGRLFRPLAWTKTLALLAAGVSGLLFVPALARAGLPAGGGAGRRARLGRVAVHLALAALLGTLVAVSAARGLRPLLGAALGFGLAALAFLAMRGERPRRVESTALGRLTARVYERLLRALLARKGPFLAACALLVVLGGLALAGARRGLALFGSGVLDLRPARALARALPGVGTTFLPPLDEGALLYMPSLLPQASLSLARDVARRQCEAFEGVPEVARAVAKVGRAESALDPAPPTMIETWIALADRSCWRGGRTREAIVAELAELARTPGLLEGAGAWLQPIEARVVMLGSGARSPLALEVAGQPLDEGGHGLATSQALAELERAARAVAARIAAVPGVRDPIVETVEGAPYLEVEIDRARAALEGVSSADILDALELAGGRVAGAGLEGRERPAFTIAYPRDLRDAPGALGDVLVRTAAGAAVPLREIAEVRARTGPAAIRTVDGRLRVFVTFGARGRDEGALLADVLEELDRWRAEGRAEGPDPLPAGVSIRPSGRFESQRRAAARLALLVPLCLATIVLLLVARFRSLATALVVLSALPVCLAGGALLVALWPALAAPFVHLGLAPAALAEPVRLSVAVALGFVALAGIATDDAVLIQTHIEDVLARGAPRTVAEVREAITSAGLRRIRPCLMTLATTGLALLPLLTSTGRGAELARPMALPIAGGMIAALVSLFVVPVLASWRLERRLGPPPGGV